MDVQTDAREAWSGDCSLSARPCRKASLVRMCLRGDTVDTACGLVAEPTWEDPDRSTTLVTKPGTPLTG